MSRCTVQSTSRHNHRAHGPEKGGATTDYRYTRPLSATGYPGDTLYDQSRFLKHHDGSWVMQCCCFTTLAHVGPQCVLSDILVRGVRTMMRCNLPLMVATNARRRMQICMHPQHQCAVLRNLFAYAASSL